MQERVWAEVSLSALDFNLETIDRLSDRNICAVVKADAYGHGAVEIARRCESFGVRYLAVATAGEARILREAGVCAPVLVLGYAPETDMLCALGITVTVFDLQQAREIHARLSSKQKIRAHFKLDTGMNRLGMKSAGEVLEAVRLGCFEPEGIFTHFATADHPGDTFVTEQAERFAAELGVLRDAGLNFPIVHCENSGGMLYYNESLDDLCGRELIRAGLTLYGWAPSEDKQSNLLPVMRFCSSVAHIKRIGEGETVSYGRTFTAERDTTLAVLSCGYADGYHRSLSNRGYAVINGKRANIIGNVCMDMMMADITDIPETQPGDTAVLFGREGPSLHELAGLAGTIPYEILCSVSARVPRVYKD